MIFPVPSVYIPHCRVTLDSFSRRDELDLLLFLPLTWFLLLLFRAMAIFAIAVMYESCRRKLSLRKSFEESADLLT